MRPPPASAAENRTHDAEKIGLSRYSDFFNRIDPSRTPARLRQLLSVSFLFLCGLRYWPLFHTI
jgi:hypothetical protein